MYQLVYTFGTAYSLLFQIIIVLDSLLRHKDIILPTNRIGTHKIGYARKAQSYILERYTVIVINNKLLIIMNY